MKQEELGLILKQILNPVSQILTISSLLLFDSVAITRYVMIFWLKNPGALNDDICSCLINVWIYFFAVISQVGFLASQGSIWILFLYNFYGVNLEIGILHKFQSTRKGLKPAYQHFKAFWLIIMHQQLFYK